MRPVLLLALALIVPVSAMAAPKPEVLGTFGKWTAFRHSEGKNKPVCYIAAPPSKSEGKYKERGEIFLLVTHRPAAKTRNVVSHVAGYEYDEKTAIVARIGKRDYMMVPKDDMAWTPNQKTDNQLVEAFREGNSVQIIGVSERKTQTTDTYSLKGISKALETIDRACALSKGDAKR